MNEEFIIINKKDTFATTGAKLFIITFMFTFLTSLAFCFVLLPKNHKYSVISSNTSSTINDDSPANDGISQENDISSEEELEKELLDNNEESISTKKNKKNSFARFKKLMSSNFNKKRKNSE
ncbi:MAG: hypothetical protein Q2306_01490 [Phytoplasma sp.]|uniref:hypothetical protein n=1 Tax=Phytoplasma sp. TaxID=2155 RepID=UPI002B41082E|nr:hypothetical protein [Phytoplasma sp.]WRH06561.1 MAG: hypothetical protein Q2306_01490 [Phytoplasma sp.]